MPAYSSEQLAHIKRLQWFVEDSPVKTAVVDYLGRVDGDGPVTEDDRSDRRFGTRSASHVIVYNLKVVSWNKAGRIAGLKEDCA
ncbi:hypothetical protein D3C71_1144820 [compost metagenome]